MIVVTYSILGLLQVPAVSLRDLELDPTNPAPTHPYCCLLQTLWGRAKYLQDPCVCVSREVNDLLPWHLLAFI